MRISDEIIERIKSETDIVDIISETVSLKRSGRNYIGLCPFHNDKSPSFSVSQDKQIYKCFSCGEAGNVITFVMKQKNMNFVEALKYLADRVNIPLEIGRGESSQVVKKKELLYKVNNEAGRYFFSNLLNDNNSKEYFLRRGISEQTIRRFGLGYAKDGFTNLLYYLRGKGYSQETLYEAGLVLKNEKRNTYYDRFRNRVMFPVFDIKGRVIGFGGRVLDDSKPKYLNSPETIVFHKGTNLYGLNYAIKNKIVDRYFIIVEGYMDCISLHQYGITNAVASLGTALTVNQARMLKRYADKVIISYDADFAGQTATLRGLDILRDAGFEVRVLNIPEGKDPDEFLRLNGREAFLKLIDNAVTLIDYRLKKAAENINFRDEQSLIQYGRKVSKILAELDPIEKDVYIKKISETTGLKEQGLYDLISAEKVKKEEHTMNNLEEVRTKLYVEPAYLKSEKSLLKLMLNKEFYEYIINEISENDFNLEAHSKIFSLIKEGNEQNASNIVSYVGSRCDDVSSSKEWVIIQETEVMQAEDINKLINDYIVKIKSFRLIERQRDLKKEQKELEAKGMIEESIRLALDLRKVNEELNKLKVRGHNGRREDSYGRN
ncbi:DNA primase [Clostridium sp. MSJ-8]|uniref:DNA primase n=1 Tax=Clostridium sp. MSJ-8 TaxID=2841510 RepID=UPI001C0EFAB9|nr:DNA primase [Clostridium sp. MSJ-8]MBU5486630.1 DNA primase [Clostridium sp. MSJ-8]